MSLHGTYDDNNLFAKILRGEIPAVKVYEDEDVLAFMDLFPQAKGHLLVVPKNVKARNFL
ncbi:MAG TPA: HIT domain-containing protein, partial [Terricaulis sp.]|nr:HIT domain-containing protein [Terricaulis sp.]